MCSSLPPREQANEEHHGRQGHESDRHRDELDLVVIVVSIIRCALHRGYEFLQRVEGGALVKGKAKRRTNPQKSLVSFKVLEFENLFPSSQHVPPTDCTAVAPPRRLVSCMNVHTQSVLEDVHGSVLTSVACVGSSVSLI